MAGIQNQGCPPLALAGAMMKDKKPFTYTPGGLDLSEIRSPRMQRRLIRNASCEGVKPSPLALSPPQEPGSPSGVVIPTGCAVQVLPMPGMDMKPTKFQGATTPPPPKELPKPKPQRTVCGPPPPPPPFVVSGGSNTGSSLPSNPLSPLSAPCDPSALNSLPAVNAIDSPNIQSNEQNASIPTPPPPPKPVGNNRRSSLVGMSTTVSPAIENLQSVLYEPVQPQPPSTLQYYEDVIQNKQQLQEHFPQSQPISSSPLSNGIDYESSFSPTASVEDDFSKEASYYNATSNINDKQTLDTASTSQQMQQSKILGQPGVEKINIKGGNSPQAISRRQSLMDQIDSIEIGPQFQEKLLTKEFNSEVSTSSKSKVDSTQNITSNKYDDEQVVEQIEPAINEPAMVKPLKRRSSINDAGKLVLPKNVSISTDSVDNIATESVMSEMSNINISNNISNFNHQDIGMSAMDDHLMAVEVNTKPPIEKITVDQQRQQQQQLQQQQQQQQLQQQQQQQQLQKQQQQQLQQQQQQQQLQQQQQQQQLQQQQQQQQQLLQQQQQQHLLQQQQQQQLLQQQQQQQQHHVIKDLNKTESNQQVYRSNVEQSQINQASSSTLNKTENIQSIGQLSLTDPIPAKLTEETPFGKALASKENTPIRQFSYRDFTPNRQYRSGSLTSSQEILNTMASLSNQTTSSGIVGQSVKVNNSSSLTNNYSENQAINNSKFSYNDQDNVINTLVDSSQKAPVYEKPVPIVNEAVSMSTFSKQAEEKTAKDIKISNIQQHNVSSENKATSGQNQSVVKEIPVQRVAAKQPNVDISKQHTPESNSLNVEKKSNIQSAVLEAVMEQDSLNKKQSSKQSVDTSKHDLTEETPIIQQNVSQTLPTPETILTQNKDIPISVKKSELNYSTPSPKFTNKPTDEYAPVRQMPVKEPTPVRVITARETTPSRPLAGEVGPHVGSSLGMMQPVKQQISQTRRMPSPPPTLQSKQNTFNLNRQASLPSHEPVQRSPLPANNNNAQSDESKSNLPSSRSPQVSPTTGLIKAPLPWMNSQRRESSAPPEFLGAPKLLPSQQRFVKQPHQSKNINRQTSQTIAQNTEQQFDRPQQRFGTSPSSNLQTQKSSPSAYSNTVTPQINNQQFVPQKSQPQPIQNTSINPPRERIIPITLERDSTPPSTSSGYSSTLTSPPTLQQNTGVERIIPISMEQESFDNQQKFRNIQKNQTNSQQSSRQFSTQQKTANFSQAVDNQFQNRHSFQQYSPTYQPQLPNSAPVSLAPSHVSLFANPTYPTSSIDNLRNSTGAFLPYNNPSDLSTSNNALEALQQMQQNLAQLNSGLQNSNQGPQQAKKNGINGITGEVAGAPVQSRSFRVLQNVLDTHESSDGVDPTEPLEEFAAPEPKKYMGGNIPSRTFKMLQAMTDDPDDVAGPGQTDL